MPKPHDRRSTPSGRPRSSPASSTWSPSRARSLRSSCRTRAHEPGLHPWCGPGRPGPPRRAARYRQLPRCHRDGGRALFRGEATAAKASRSASWHRGCSKPRSSFVGIVNVLAIVTLRETVATAADPGSWVAIGQSMVAVRDRTFVLGTGVPALNAALLGWLMYRSRLVPRAIPVVGLIGAPLFTSGSSATPWASPTAAARGHHRGRPDLPVGAVARPLDDLHGLQPDITAHYSGRESGQPRPRSSPQALLSRRSRGPHDGRREADPKLPPIQ